MRQEIMSHQKLIDFFSFININTLIHIMAAALKNCEWFQTLKKDELTARPGGQYLVPGVGVRHYLKKYQFKSEARMELITALDEDSDEELAGKLQEVFRSARNEKRAQSKDVRLHHFIAAVNSLPPLQNNVDTDRLQTLVGDLSYASDKENEDDEEDEEESESAADSDSDSDPEDEDENPPERKRRKKTDGCIRTREALEKVLDFHESNIWLRRDLPSLDDRNKYSKVGVERE